MHKNQDYTKRKFVKIEIDVDWGQQYFSNHLIADTLISGYLKEDSTSEKLIRFERSSQDFVLVSDKESELDVVKNAFSSELEILLHNIVRKAC